MTKVCVIGHFGGNKKFIDGQTIKTKNIYDALKEKYNEKVEKIDTYNWKKRPFGFAIKCIKGIKKSKNIIIMPAHNGVKVFVPFFVFLNRFYHKKIFYVVIGGWLPELLKDRKRLSNKMKRLDKIFVETTTMKEKLKEMDINNTDVLVNFKKISPLKENNIKTFYKKPYKLCTFSRVLKEKGIEDAIETVKQINKESQEIVYTLDIYGPVDEKYKDRFYDLKLKFPKFITYKGCVDSEKAVDVLKDYFLLLFPTKYKTEGIPGTIIDSFAAGVPIIASEWENVYDLLENEKNGYIYEFNNIKKMKELLKNIKNDKVVEMKYECLKSAEKFMTQKAISNLIKEMENVE